MLIRLLWTDRNESEDGTYVYRSTSPILVNELPDPYATLEAGVTKFDDTNVERGEVYYYRLGVFKGEQLAVSNQITAHAVQRSGPGPQTLIEGDYEAGYFGKVSPVDLFNGYELVSAVGLTGFNLQNTFPTWFKFAYKGKILFIPMKPLGWNKTWNDLYHAGLVYGTDDNGPGFLKGVTPTNQYKTVTKNGDQFIVRLINGSPRNPSPTWGIVSGTFEVFDLNGCEWNDLICRVAAAVPFRQEEPNWEDNIWSDISFNYNSSPVWCQELVNDTHALTRNAYNPVNTQHFVGYARPFAKNVAGENVPYSVYHPNSNPYVYCSWQPVLEFVPEPIVAE